MTFKSKKNLYQGLSKILRYYFGIYECKQGKYAKKQRGSKNASERAEFFLWGGPICTKNKRIDFGLKLSGKLLFLIGFKMKSTYSNEYVLLNLSKASILRVLG